MNAHKGCCSSDCVTDAGRELDAAETITPWHELRKDAEWCRCLLGPVAVVIEDDKQDT
jgi:hypothetical protein